MRYDEHVEGPASWRFGGKKESQIPTAIERRRLRIKLSDVSEGSSLVGCIILSCDPQNIRAPLCAECNGAVIDARTWIHLVVPPRGFASCPWAKEVDRTLNVQDADGKILTGHYHVIQVSTGLIRRRARSGASPRATATMFPL